MNLQEREDIRTRLLAAGVRHLKDLNFIGIDTTLILTDRLYMAFFRSFIDELKGRSPNVDQIINELKKELE